MRSPRPATTSPAPQHTRPRSLRSATSSLHEALAAAVRAARAVAKAAAAQSFATHPALSGVLGCELVSAHEAERRMSTDTRERLRELPAPMRAEEGLGPHGACSLGEEREQPPLGDAPPGPPARGARRRDGGTGDRTSGSCSLLGEAAVRGPHPRPFSRLGRRVESHCLSRVPWIGSNTVTALASQHLREPPPPAPPPQVGAGSADPPSTRAAAARAGAKSYAVRVDDLAHTDIERDPHSLPPLVGAGPGVGARRDG
jgi:hypothetical protein